MFCFHLLHSPQKATHRRIAGISSAEQDACPFFVKPDLLFSRLMALLNAKRIQFIGGPLQGKNLL